jgi:hypothetical protein
MDDVTQDPSVSLLEQIDDQSLDINGGSHSLVGLVSWYLGNSGAYCTLSVECQANGC